jgi:hypothetical protein
VHVILAEPGVVASARLVSSPALAEGVLLSLVVGLPAAFNPAGILAFEPEKASLLRVGAVLVAAAWLAWRFRGRPTVDVGRQPLVRAALAFAFVTLISTGLSLQPALSFFGSFDRDMGWLTVAAGAVLMLAGADLWTDSRRRERLVSALVIGALIPSAYVLLQRTGRDPIPWSTLGAPGSTLGSPTFLGGYLVMVAPFALYRVVAGAQAALSGTWRASAVYVVWLAALLIIGAVLVQTTIRGPLLGLVCGTLTFALLLGRPGRVAIFGAFGFVALTLLLASFATGSAGLAAVGRLIRIAGTGDSSVERLVVWRDALTLPLVDPVRALVGFGPETQAAVFERAEATVRLTQNAQWDRAHSLLLDTWLTGGALGVVGLVGLIAVALATTPRWSPLAAAVLAALVGHLVEASFAFQTVVTGTLFWVVLGLAASLAPRRLVGATASHGSLAALGIGVSLALAPLLAAPAIGDALYGARQYAAASAWLPWVEEPVRASGLAWQRVGDAGRAETDLREAARRAPLEPTPAVRLVRFYLLYDRLDDAEAACQRALALGPYRATVWDACADISSRRGTAQEAQARRARAEDLRK